VTYEPNGTQVDVIASTAPVLVVRGGAGTGKTTTAVAAARAHLEAADWQLRAARHAAITVGERTRLPATSRALFLSFSRTAVAQIIDRAADVIGPFASRLEVATFDGFAWRIITSFGAHYGFPPPQAVLSSANSRVPGAPSGLTYDQLIPAAVQLLAIPNIAEHYGGRYGIVICDEFQDTDAEEWAFLQMIAPSARRILLGDLNQCIYHGFKTGVDPAARIAAASEQPGAISIDLPPASFRDPSGLLPAAADAARKRRFADPAIQAAASARRLSITPIDDGIGHAQVIDLARQARHRGHTVSIFTHTIAATTALSDALTAAGLSHEQVGFGEAYGEALPAQLALVQFALGDISAPVRRTLAVYVTATLGGRDTSPPPPLAKQLYYGTNPTLERALGQLIADLQAAGGTSPDLDLVANIVGSAYSRIGTFRGQETWTRAAHRTHGILRLLGNDHSLAAVIAELLRARDETLVGNLTARPRPIQVMNLHQTKGREADTTILLLGPDEYHGSETEPYPDGSRLLYVVMTRARRQAHLVVPANPHPLWQPLIVACDVSNQLNDRAVANSAMWSGWYRPPRA
jgi:ATP-dependent DNA helicase UvrD/PcrA